MIRRVRHLWAAGLVFGLSSLTGCQTWIAGMTLPSGRYLDHPPQYFPPDPDFPLTRELAYQEEQAGLLRPIAPGAVVPGGPGVPPPVPGLPAPPAPGFGPPVIGVVPPARPADAMPIPPR